MSSPRFDVRLKGWWCVLVLGQVIHQHDAAYETGNMLVRIGIRNGWASTSPAKYRGTSEFGVPIRMKSNPLSIWSRPLLLNTPGLDALFNPREDPI
jgi:hypothetical protein